MRNFLKITFILLISGPTLTWAAEQLYFTYGFEEGNSLVGQYYGQQEYRHTLKSALEKKMDNFKLLSEFSMYYSSLDQIHLQTVRLAFNQMSLGPSLLSIGLGDNNPNLPYNAGLWNNRIRGASADYQYDNLTAGVFGGTPSDLYRESASLSSRNVLGSYVGYKPAAWFSGKIFLYKESSSLPADSLYRRATGFGQQMDITMSQGLSMMMATAWKKRQEERTGVIISRSAPWVSANIAWTAKKYSFSAGLDFLGANFRPLQTKNYYGPRFYASWRPNEIIRMDGRFTNYNADGDTLYPMITNSWGAGSSVKLSNLPSLKVSYTSRDNKVSWGGPNARRYVSDGQTMELSQKFNQLEMKFKYQVENREEKIDQSMDASRHLWMVKPQYRSQLATFWLSGEFDRWSDNRRTTSGYYNRYRAGTNAGLWSGSRAIVELGFNQRVDQRDRNNTSMVASLNLKFNLSKKYLLDLSWWNENNIAQDTGFFYLRDRSRLGLFVTRRIDISGNDLEGLVFLDANKNGFQDAGEFGLPGIILNLSNGRKTITDARGKYSFTNINSSNPTVKIDMASLSAEYNIIGAGEKQASLGGWRSTLVNFTVSALGGIKGRVFVDNNNNGVFDGDDYGMSGVMVIIQPSNTAAISNGGGMFRITNAPTGQQTLNIDLNSIPPDYELKSQPSRSINIKQGEISNHLEFAVVKKIRPVKKVVFGGVSTVKINTSPRAEAAPRSAGSEKQAARAPKQQDRVTIKAKEPPPSKLSATEIDALYKEGTKLYSSGDYQGALKIWQKILAADPGHSQAKRNLEKTRQKLDALKKAKG
jgi:hypothetical protein